MAGSFGSPGATMAPSTCWIRALVSRWPRSTPEPSRMSSPTSPTLDASAWGTTAFIADNCRLFGLSIPAAARRLDRDNVFLFEPAADLRWQLFVVQEVLTNRSRLSALRPLRGVAATVGKEGEARGVEHSHGAHDAVPAPVFAAAAGVVEEFIALDAHGVLHLEGLYWGVHGVRHAGVDAGRTGAFFAGAWAAAYGLIVGPAPTADDRVVHRPLALRRELFRSEVGEGREDGVGDAVARLDVPGYDR